MSDNVVNYDHAHVIIDAPSIVLCTDPIDLRFGIDGLCNLVKQNYNQDIYKTIFVFLNKTKTKIKVLAWHHNGFILLYKKLEKGNKFFDVGNRKTDIIKITKEQLNWIITGLDWITIDAFGYLEYKAPKIINEK